ncbi:MAG TPA: tetratricopeptide repeat protein [Edaphocola sp.]|nr:tetratricopeptide repeat protein [Edaphocola sp.]
MSFKQFRKNYCLFVVMLFTGLSARAAFAQSAGSLWIQGNRQYAQKQYELALKSFQQLEKSGLKNAALFYNMGNTCYRLDETAAAVLYYEKALFLDPANSRIKDNLSLAQARVQLPMTPVAPVFFIAWWHEFIRLFSPSVWAWLMLACFLGGLWFVYTNLARSSRTKFAGRWLSLLIAGFSLSAILFYAGYQARTYSNKAVVMMDNTSFYNHRDDVSANGQLPEGAVVKIRHEHAGFYEVTLPNGSKAWIRVSAVARVCSGSEI